MAGAIAMVLAAGISAYSASEQRSAAEKGISAQYALTGEGIQAQKDIAETERLWQLEDELRARGYREEDIDFYLNLAGEEQDYNLMQELEAERRQAEYSLEQARLQEEAIIRAEERGESRDIAAEGRAKDFVREQQQRYEDVVGMERELLLQLSQPYRDLALQTIPELEKFIGDYKFSPTYELQKEEGLAEIDKQMSAMGLKGSGAEIEAKSNFVRKLEAEEADKMYGKQMQIAQFGASQQPNLPSAATGIYNVGGGTSVGTQTPTYYGTQANVAQPASTTLPYTTTTPSSAPTIGNVGSLYGNAMSNLPALYNQQSSAYPNMLTNLVNAGMYYGGKYGN